MGKFFSARVLYMQFYYKIDASFFEIGLKLQWEQEIFSSPHPSRLALGPTSLLCSVSWVKQLASNVDNPPPSSKEVMSEKTYNCTLPLCQSWHPMGIIWPYFFWILVTHHMRYIRLGYRRIREDAGKGCWDGAGTKLEFIVFCL